MSLLLDAIKKAEKREAEQATAAKPAEGLAIEASPADSVELTIDEGLLESDNPDTPAPPIDTDLIGEGDRAEAIPPLDDIALSIDEKLLDPAQENEAITQTGETVEYDLESKEPSDQDPLASPALEETETPQNPPADSQADNPTQADTFDLATDRQSSEVSDPDSDAPGVDSEQEQKQEQPVVADFSAREGEYSDPPPAPNSVAAQPTTDGDPAPAGLTLEDEIDVEVTPTPLPQRDRKFSLVRFALLLLLGLFVVLIFYYLSDPATDSASQQTQMTDRGSTNYHLAVTPPVDEAAVGAGSESDSQAAAVASPSPASVQSDAESPSLLIQPAPESVNEPLIDPSTPSIRAAAGDDYLEPAAGENLIIQRQVDSAGPRVMNQARTALDQGNLNEAERLYEQWLTQRPHSTAARFGLARLFLLQGKVDQARLMYLDILQIEPVNSTAQASLINLPGTGSPESRRRLQFLLEQNPDDPYLNYVMGNQQAGLTRWDEAQKYYFQATALKRDNAIYAFNLAIALDHLQKPDAAASYYRRALELTNPPLGQAHRQQVIDRLKNIANTKG